MKEQLEHIFTDSSKASHMNFKSDIKLEPRDIYFTKNGWCFKKR